MQLDEVSDTVQVIARAGAGTNNIPVEQLTSLGIPVLNTPGANANAVKELVITSMLLACRHICEAWDFVRQLPCDDDLKTSVEKHKKQFSGFELPGKTLGVIGLGNIGVKVANAALALDMQTIGFDPAMTIQNAWELSANVQRAEDLNELIQKSDFITIHVPYNDKTHCLINQKLLQQMKASCILLNFARNGIVDNAALLAALESQKLACYVTDFPEKELQNQTNIISLPHLGASTLEAEINCAIMAVRQVMRFLKTGEIKHAVNFPSVLFPKKTGERLAIVNQNVPNMVAQMSHTISEYNYNIIDMINKSRNDIAYTLFDLNGNISPELITALSDIPGVTKVRHIS